MLRGQFQPGFRLSAIDVAVLLIGSATLPILVPTSPEVAFVIAFVVGHFFLFCNVVRMGRPLELLWSAVFLTLAGATISAGQPGWMLTTILSLAMTIIVVVTEMRKPSYHGVGWQIINPGLPDWWAQTRPAPHTEDA